LIGHTKHQKRPDKSGKEHRFGAQKHQHAQTRIAQWRTRVSIIIAMTVTIAIVIRRLRKKTVVALA
jgi:hypothetical protein